MLILSLIHIYPLYYNETYKSLADGKTYNDCIVIKGQNTSGHWEMSSVVSEHFADVYKRQP